MCVCLRAYVCVCVYAVGVAEENIGRCLMSISSNEDPLKMFDSVPF